MERTTGILLMFGMWQVTLLLAVCVGLLLSRSSAPVPTAGAETFSQLGPKPAVEEGHRESTALAGLQDTIRDLKKERDRLSNSLLRLSLQQTLDRALNSGKGASDFLLPHAMDHVGDAWVDTQPSSREFLQATPLGHLPVNRPAQYLGAPWERQRELGDNWNREALEGRLFANLGDELEAWEATLGRREFGLMPPNRHRTPRSGSGLGVGAGAGAGRTSETLDQLEAMLLLLRDIQYNASRGASGRFGQSAHPNGGRESEERVNRLMKSLLLFGLLRTIADEGIADASSTLQ